MVRTTFFPTFSFTFVIKLIHSPLNLFMRQKIQNLFFLFLLGAIGAKAQGPVITADSANPQIGDNFNLQGTSSFSLNFVASGTNNVWDFSNLVDSGPVMSVSYISPVGQTFADSFPTSNIAAIYNGDMNDVEFDQINSAAWSEVGAYSGYFNLLEWNVPASPYMVYPMSVGTTYTNSYQSVVESTNGVNPPYAYIQYDTIIAVGSGALKLPTGIFNNVLCVYLGSGNYSFVTNGIHYPLLTISPAEDSNGNNINGWWQGVYNIAYPLPLQISSFTASWQKKMPYLQWEAANTENTKAFNIQRSVDGHGFSTVGQVGASGGSSYHFEDNYIPTSTVYYRLQQVDKNGQSFYSSTAQLTVNSKQLTVYPNPAKGTIHVSVPSTKTVHVMIYDAIGRLVYENKNYSSAQPIATDTWSKGTYLVRVKDNEGWKVSSFEVN